MDNKIRAYDMLPTRDPIQGEGYTQIERERLWKKIYHANENDKKAGVTILTSDKRDFETKFIKINKALYSDKRINTRRGYYTP